MRATGNTAMEPTNLRRQRGAVLMVSLLILLLLTLLTLTAIQASTVQERLAGNARSLDLALQAAEASLREGEGRLVRLFPGQLPAARKERKAVKADPEALTAFRARLRTWLADNDPGLPASSTDDDYWAGQAAWGQVQPPAVAQGSGGGLYYLGDTTSRISASTRRRNSSLNRCASRRPESTS